jgi:membrane-associated phospholipid phosphatase
MAMRRRGSADRGALSRRHALTLGAGGLAALLPRGGEAVQSAPGDRAARAHAIRVEAAAAQRRRPPVRHAANGDEARYPDLIASYGKGLPHTPGGEVDPRAFAALAQAMRTGATPDLEAIPLGGVMRQVNPCAAFAFTMEGPDPHTIAMPAPPTFDSAALASEACELYWQALTRDVPFDAYAADPAIARACTELSALPAFPGPRAGGAVTPATLFRGSTPGDLAGPYVSQFLWKEVPYGTIRLVPHVRTATPGLDYQTAWDDWLAVQNGVGTAARHAGPYRYIRSARDLAAYVQLDFSYQPFLTACLVLFGMEGTTDVRRPYKGAPFEPSIPYRTSKTQTGFVTLGVAHVLDLVARVAKLTLQHAWFHKWLVHRWLRPEEFGGRVHRVKSGQARHPVHPSLLDSVALRDVFDRTRSYLLPQAYPEGCPLHPSYPSGHAVIAGACATVLKAFFDESFPIEEPVVPRRDGLSLEPYTGPALTVGGELNKLAANVSLGRAMAGIHWRCDGAAGLALGEQVALDLLRELRTCGEPFDGFSLTTFAGERVEV